MKPELKEKYERAKAEIDRINNGGSWRMTIPVHPLNSDMIFYDALCDMAAEIERLEANPQVVNNYYLTNNSNQPPQDLKEVVRNILKVKGMQHE